MRANIKLLWFLSPLHFSVRETSGFKKFERCVITPFFSSTPKTPEEVH